MSGAAPPTANMLSGGDHATQVEAQWILRLPGMASRHISLTLGLGPAVAPDWVHSAPWAHRGHPGPPSSYRCGLEMMEAEGSLGTTPVPGTMGDGLQ